jgi:hypothetical protein
MCRRSPTVCETTWRGEDDGVSLAKAGRDGTSAQESKHWVIGEEEESVELEDGKYMSSSEARMALSYLFVHFVGDLPFGIHGGFLRCSVFGFCLDLSDIPLAFCCLYLSPLCSYL